MLHHLLSLVAVAVGTPGNVRPAIDAVEIKTPDGTLRVDLVQQNKTMGNSTWLRARGIQYAEHPVGSRRWVPPVPFAPWGGVVDANEWG